jgi:putative flippase GtrA
MMRLRELYRRHREILLYLVVGGINTLFGYGIYALGLWIGLEFRIAAVISQVLGTLFNYGTYGRVVFHARPGWIGITKFVLSYMTLMAINIGLLTLFHSWGASPLLAGVFSGLIMPVLSFLSNKLIVFRKPVNNKPA